MNKKELAKVLENHKHWIEEDCDGWEGMKADLRGADLCGANLYGANLYGADLREADLCEADLCEADLRGANLRGANLYGANLHGANLYGADLRGANLYGANLRGANLRGAKIEESLKTNFFPLACPESGAFIGWKRCGEHIVKLQIAEDAKRSSAYGRKCRCSKADVLAIEAIEGETDITEIASDRDPNFVYRVGETVEVPDFDEDRWNECSTGIHFFIMRQEAVDYDG